jgi:hypothetical protein
MALYGVLKNGADGAVPDKHVGSDGSHRDESATLRLDRSAGNARSISRKMFPPLS